MSDTEAKTALQAQMLANRLLKRFRHLHKWAGRTGTNAFRLYDRDIPEIPLVLDIYDDCLSGALYKRPYEKDEIEETQWLAAMKDAIAQSLGLERDNIIIKQREHQRQNSGSRRSQYEKMAARNVTRIVNEGGLRFKVNLSDYLDTGLFLDRRLLRRMAAAGAKGKRVLNLFCYTGSFSVHAAKGGALSTDSVDLSNTYSAWARKNFFLNGIDTDVLKWEELTTELHGVKTGCSHRLIRADVAAFLQKAAEAALTWDSIILDPPAFSNSTMADDFDLNRDYKALLENCLALLSPNGKLWFSASSRSFKVGTAELETGLKGNFPNVAVVDLSDKIIDEDFIGKKVPKSYVITAGSG